MLIETVYQNIGSLIRANVAVGGMKELWIACQRVERHLSSKLGNYMSHCTLKRESGSDHASASN